MDPVVYTITFPAQTKCLQLVRSSCRKVLDEIEVSPEIHRKAVLAIDEAVANVMEHAKCPDARELPALIQLRVRVDENRIHIQLQDRGLEFDPSHAEAPAAPALRAQGSNPGGAPLPRRGYGLHLIRQIVDEIGYERTRGGENVLTMSMSTAGAKGF